MERTGRWGIRSVSRGGPSGRWLISVVRGYRGKLNVKPRSVRTADSRPPSMPKQNGSPWLDLWLVSDFPRLRAAEIDAFTGRESTAGNWIINGGTRANFTTYSDRIFNWNSDRVHVYGIEFYFTVACQKFCKGRISIVKNINYECRVQLSVRFLKIRSGGKNFIKHEFFRSAIQIILTSFVQYSNTRLFSTFSLFY